MFQATDFVFNTESIPSHILYKSLKTYGNYFCKIPTVITETLTLQTSDAPIWKFTDIPITDIGDYLKCELRVASCELRVTSILLSSNNIGSNFNPGLTLTWL